MTKEEFINSIKNCEVNENKVKKTEQKYGALSDCAKKIISLIGNEPIFFDTERRLISFKELESATEFLGVDFISKSLIPVIDCFDNDFIAYDYKNNKWVSINIVDECIFDEQECLKDII